MNRLTSIVLAIAVMGCGRLGFDATGDGRPPAELTRRNRIDVRGSVLAEGVVEFPLLVQLRAPEFDSVAVRADGADLRFYAADQITELPYDLEQVSAIGADAWVRIPQIASGTDDVIWVYYGNATAAAGQRPEQVWSTEYIAVWHLGSDGRDSTSNHLDGTFTGTAVTTGVAGLGRDLQLGWLEVSDAPPLAMIGSNGTATWSAWAKPVAIESITSALIDRQAGTTAADDFRLGPTSAGDLNGQINLDPGQQDLAWAGGSFTYGVWQLFAMVRDGSTLRASVNGVPVSTVVGTGTGHASANPVWLGAGCNNCSGSPTNDHMDGVLDEARIESVARSDGWLTAEYLNLTGGLVVVSPFEQN
ncbi:hypothetical protein BH11MYX1_BH11MYX1_07510 [soil metagenome]